jgi:hypothetical protein
LNGKTAILILGGISILVIIFLIASLGGLTFKPAEPFTLIRVNATDSLGNPPAWHAFVYIIPIMIALLIGLVIILPPDQRKKLLTTAAWLILAGVIFILVISKNNFGKLFRPPPPEKFEEVVTLVPASTHTPGLVVTPSVFIPPLVSSWTSYFVALGILLFAVALWMWIQSRRKKSAAPYAELAEIARSTLDDIDAGKDWGDAILNSYFRMTGVVSEWRGIHRGLAMTPSEFADFLVSRQFPGEAVYPLTALFERVRYGDKHSPCKDIQEAVDCLNIILDYCREPE